MCIELERKKSNKNNKVEDKKENDQIVEKVKGVKSGNGQAPDPECPHSLKLEKLDEELLEINNEIRYIRKLQARHQELIHHHDQIHKGIEEIWRKQAYNQREAKRTE